MAVPAAAQDALAADEMHEHAAATKTIADGVNQSTGNVARQMLDLVAREAKAKATLEDSVERKQRRMSLDEMVSESTSSDSAGTSSSKGVERAER